MYRFIKRQNNSHGRYTSRMLCRFAAEHFILRFWGRSINWLKVDDLFCAGSIYTKHSTMYRHSPLSLLAVAGLLLLSSACSKNNEKEEVLPELGPCKPVSLSSRLNYNSASGEYTYTTSGGGKISIGLSSTIKIGHRDYEGFGIELWGTLTTSGGIKLSGNHENLNGKHLKDRLGNRRTIVFPDGAKLTIVTKGPADEIISFSIYDVAESHHINFGCNTVEYSGQSAFIAKSLDDAEADGETATFELTATGLLLYNIYHEDEPGNKVYERVMLGELSRSQPNMVNDYFDDPRLGHT